MDKESPLEFPDNTEIKKTRPLYKIGDTLIFRGDKVKVIGSHFDLAIGNIYTCEVQNQAKTVMPLKENLLEKPND